MTIPTTVEAVLRVARSQVGVRESPFGSNQTKYGRAYGWNGVAWCAIFVWWVFRQAGADLKEMIGPGLQYTPTFAAHARAKGWVRVNFEGARPGDIVFFDFPDSIHRIQHVGIVLRRSRSTMTCIEGNTSTSSDDNGGAVMERIRRADVVKVIYRPPYEEDDDMAMTPEQFAGLLRHPTVKKALADAPLGADRIVNRSWKPGDDPTAETLSPATVLSQLEDDGDKIRSELKALREVVDLTATRVRNISRAVAKLAPGVIDVDALADAVVDEEARRLKS